MEIEHDLDAVNADNDRDVSADDMHPTEGLAAARRELASTAPVSASTTTSPPPPNGSTVAAAADVADAASSTSPTSPAPLHNLSASAAFSATDPAAFTAEQELATGGHGLPEDDDKMAEEPRRPADLLLEDLRASSADDPAARPSASAGDHPDNYDDCEMAQDRPARAECEPASEVDEAEETVDVEREPGEKSDSIQALLHSS